MYKRILLKMSGEALKGTTEFGIDPKTVKEVALQIKKVQCNITPLLSGPFLAITPRGPERLPEVAPLI